MIMMKPKRRLLAMLMMVCIIGSAFSIPVFAASHDYSFNMPSNFLGSMQYSSICTRDATLPTPYVKPSVTTISTMYFLSPSRTGSTQATNVVYVTTASKKTFTWKSGYGGAGTSYCLAGCPNPDNGSWNAYSVSGIWCD